MGSGGGAAHERTPTGGRRSALEKGFDACLLTDEEMKKGPRTWSRFTDPFPTWDVD